MPLQPLGVGRTQGEWEASELPQGPEDKRMSIGQEEYQVGVWMLQHKKGTVGLAWKTPGVSEGQWTGHYHGDAATSGQKEHDQ